MLNYMEKELAFESTESELNAVMQKLKEQKSIHHAEGLTEEEGRRSLMQCLRTTIVLGTNWLTPSSLTLQRVRLSKWPRSLIFFLQSDGLQ